MNTIHQAQMGDPPAATGEPRSPLDLLTLTPKSESAVHDIAKALIELLASTKPVSELVPGVVEDDLLARLRQSQPQPVAVETPPGTGVETLTTDGEHLNYQLPCHPMTMACQPICTPPMQMIPMPLINVPPGMYPAAPPGYMDPMYQQPYQMVPYVHVPIHVAPCSMPRRTPTKKPIVVDSSESSDSNPPITPDTFRSRRNNAVSTAWTKDEDEALKQGVKLYNAKCWRKIAEYVHLKCKDAPKRTPDQCNQRWTRTINPVIVKGSWPPEEDELLIQAVKANAPRNWKGISAMLPSRTDVQIRGRLARLAPMLIEKNILTKEQLPPLARRRS